MSIESGGGDCMTGFGSSMHGAFMSARTVAMALHAGAASRA